MLTYAIKVAIFAGCVIAGMRPWADVKCELPIINTAPTTTTTTLP